MEATENNIWDSFSTLTGKTVDAYQNIVNSRVNADVSIAQINANAFTAINGRAGAAPSGTPSVYNQNIPPGLFGSFPQAQGKPIPGGAPTGFTSLFSSSGSGLGTDIFVGVIASLIVAVIFVVLKGR